MVVCSAAQENGAHKWSKHIDRKNKDAIFMHLYIAPWCIPQLAPNLQWSYPPHKGDHISNLNKIPQALPKILACKTLIQLLNGSNRTVTIWILAVH